MIGALDLIKFLRHGKDTLMAHGNKQLDRNVFAYLADVIDLNTGLVGKPYKVSHSRIALDISEKGCQGSRSVPTTFSSRQVRNAVDRLIAYGLYDRLSEKAMGGQLLLRACVVNVSNELSPPSFNQNEVGMRLATSKQGDNNYNSNTYDDSVQLSESEVGINSPSFLPTVPANKKMSMSLDWEPTDKFKETINKTYKPSPATANGMKSALVDFMLYWTTQDIQLTQTEWEAKLFRNDLKPVLMGEVSVASRSAVVSSKNKKMTVLSVPDKLYGELLQKWGVRHGFRAVNPGESDAVYKQQLQNYVKRTNARRERDSVIGG